MAASGFDRTEYLNRSHVYRRVSSSEIRRYDEIFPYVDTGSLLEPPYPARYEHEMIESAPDSFAPAACIAYCGVELKEVR